MVIGMIPIITVVGTSKSGKTTLIEYLISHLSKEGLKIGTIKHVHHAGFSIDVKGKDTWRHSQAGAEIVVTVAPKEIAIIKKGENFYQELDEILDLVKDEKLDLLIIEGFHSLAAKRQNIFKIITAKNEEDLRRTLEGTVDPILAITGIITQQKLVLPEISTPIIDLKDRGKKIIELIKSKVLNF
jgi:molybdopterin-guanine dinucleotide biosynthesis protein MobB